MTERRLPGRQQQEAVQPVRRAYLPEPAIPDLLQVEQTVAAEVAGFQELDWG